MMDSNILLGIVIIAAAVAVIFYLKKHAAEVKAAVQSAATDVQSHVSGVVSNAQADLTQSIVTAPLTARVAAQVPLSPDAATPSATASTATASPPTPTNAAADVGNVIETAPPAAQNDASSTQAAVVDVPAAPEPSTTAEQPQMRLAFTPSYIQMTAQPDAAGVVNIPWPVVPHIGVICNGVPSNPGPAGLRFRFKPGVMRKPVGTLKFNGNPEITAWEVSLVNAATGAVVAAMPGNWLHFVVDAEPAQSDWYRLDSTTVYDVVAKRRTAEVALEASRFDLEN